LTETVVITGAAGFIGSTLTDYLLEKGLGVTGIDDLRTGQMSNLAVAMDKPQFRLIRRDISEGNLELWFPEGCNTIFHLAAISSVKLSTENPALVKRVNVTGTKNVVDLARRNDIERIVFTSSAAVYGNPSGEVVTEDSQPNPLSPYGESKLEAEEVIRTLSKTYGLEFVILRLFNVYGPRQAYSDYSGVVSIFANKIVMGEEIAIDGDGSQTRSFLYVDDIVRALVLSTSIPEAIGETVNIASDDAIAILNLAHMMRDIAKVPNLRITHGPPREGDIKESLTSTRKAVEVLGFTPEVALDVGLRWTIDWYRDHLAKDA
jgi:UDP-glucose 4-epimerase